MIKPHIVLVHGAYHRVWHFRLLKANLEEAGYKVSTLDLPSSGDNAPAQGALAADVAAIRTMLEDAAAQSGSVLPVFHSYGGVPGGDAAGSLSEATRAKIQRLVFLAAFVIPENGSLRTDGNNTPTLWIRREGDYVVVPDPIPVFYNDIDPVLAKEAAAHVVKQSGSAFTDKTQHAGWKTLPSTYVYCSDDQAIPRWQSNFMFGRMKEEDKARWEFLTIPGGHSPFLADPEGCANVLRRIAGESI